MGGLEGKREGLDGAWKELGKSLAVWTSLGRKAWMGLGRKERRLGWGLDEAWLLGRVLGEKLGRLGRVLKGRKGVLDGSWTEGKKAWTRLEGKNEGLEGLGGTSKAGRKATWKELSCVTQESLAIPKPSIHPTSNHLSS